MEINAAFSDGCEIKYLANLFGCEKAQEHHDQCLITSKWFCFRGWGAGSRIKILLQGSSKFHPKKEVCHVHQRSGMCQQETLKYRYIAQPHYIGRLWIKNVRRTSLDHHSPHSGHWLDTYGQPPSRTWEQQVLIWNLRGLYFLHLSIGNCLNSCPVEDLEETTISLLGNSSSSGRLWNCKVFWNAETGLVSCTTSSVTRF